MGSPELMPRLQRTGWLKALSSFLRVNLKQNRDHEEETSNAEIHTVFHDAINKIEEEKSKNDGRDYSTGNT